MMRSLLRPLIILIGLLAFWQLLVWLTSAESFILPGPIQVIATGIANWQLLLDHAGTTVLEIILGLLIGTTLGAASALLVDRFAPVRRWLMPVLVLSQAIPVFAIAPVLVIWLGFGLASKVTMTCLIIFFPVTAAFLDGLRRTEPGWLDLGRTMLAGHGNLQWRLTWQIKIPAALPALATGLRVATAVAPIGAVVGEWVGSARGLGFLMLHANARMEVDLMFAALALLAVFTISLYYLVDWGLRRLIPWQSEQLETLKHAKLN